MIGRETRRKSTFMNEIHLNGRKNHLHSLFKNHLRSLYSKNKLRNSARVVQQWASCLPLPLLQPIVSLYQKAVAGMDRERPYLESSVGTANETEERWGKTRTLCDTTAGAQKRRSGCGNRDDDAKYKTPLFFHSWPRCSTCSDVATHGCLQSDDPRPRMPRDTTTTGGRRPFDVLYGNKKGLCVFVQWESVKFVKIRGVRLVTAVDPKKWVSDVYKKYNAR